MKNTIIAVFILFVFTSCLHEDELKKPFESFAPANLNDGWQISDPASENINADELKEIYVDFHSDPDYWQVRSLLVFRNNKLVAESYTKDDRDIDTPRAIWSETKQVVGILTGMAMDRGLIGSVNDSILHYLPEMAGHPEKNGITIEHLLTMKSGIDYSNDELSGQTDDILRRLHDSIIGFILSRPQHDAPGSVCNYKDCDPQLIAAILQKQCGKPLSEWANENLFNPLGIKNLHWNSYKDGTTLGGFGILTTPREMAKFGQLIMDNGKWKGTQIVSEEWIKEMTTVRVSELYNMQFGYLWWSEQTRNILMMNGHGGQYVIVSPEKRLLVVMTAEVNTQGSFQFRDPLKWYDRIIAACN